MITILSLVTSWQGQAGISLLRVGRTLEALQDSWGGL